MPDICGLKNQFWVQFTCGRVLVDPMGGSIRLDRSLRLSDLAPKKEQIWPSLAASRCLDVDGSMWYWCGLLLIIMKKKAWS